MTRQEAYRILEINETTNAEEIKKAYKSKAKKYHPDIYQGDKKLAEEKMKQINEAYDLLSTPRQTNTYNSSNDFSEAYARTQQAYEEFKHQHKIFEEHLKKMQEDLERIQKEREESRRKMLKASKILLYYLFFLVEFYLVLLLSTAIKGIILAFNEAIWILFGYWILLGIMALAATILAPFGFRWLLKRAGIIK